MLDQIKPTEVMRFLKSLEAFQFHNFIKLLN